MVESASLLVDTVRESGLVRKSSVFREFVGVRQSDLVGCVRKSFLVGVDFTSVLYGPQFCPSFCRSQACLVSKSGLRFANLA